jgi:general secretion pathway protein F
VSPPRRFRYLAPDQGGKLSARTLYAHDRQDALRQLRENGAAPVALTEAESGATRMLPSRVAADEASLVLRQLAVMASAGVELLDALEAAATALEGRLSADQLRGAAMTLRRGEPFAKALAAHAPHYPPYVFALLRAGEASGRLGPALEEAARQMQLEARLSRDIQNALVYPAFLVLGGALSIAFILYAVAPRFAEMLGQARTQLDPLSAGIISAGVWFHGNAVLAALVFAGAVAALFAFAATGEGKRLLAGVAYAVPGLGGLLKARQRTTWSRIMAILLAAGVDVLAATRTAAEALSEGALRRNALAAIAHLRAGRSVDQAFLAANAVSPIEASVIAAGSRSGALAAMFEAVAQKAEEDTRDALKRFTTILEPLAIALVAGFIGMIVVALVSALAGIYEAIG